MTTNAATPSRSPATTHHEARPGRLRRRPGGTSAAPHNASDLPREYRIAHVFRTLGRGLVAEYDPD
jgi:hypothetical protein